MADLKIGDWVRWHSAKRKRWMTGQLVAFTPTGKAYLIVTSWDGRGHHWVEPLHKLRKVTL